MADPRETLPRFAAGREDLFDLALRLRRHGFEVTPAQLTEAHDLLLGLRLSGVLPAHRPGWRPYLAPVFCRSADEQDAFRRLFADWAEPAPEHVETDPDRSDDSANGGKAGRARQQRCWLRAGSGTSLLVLLWLAILWLMPPYRPPERPQDLDKPSVEEELRGGQGQNPDPVAPEDTKQPLPVRPPETIPPTTESGWSSADMRLMLAALPLAAWSLWLATGLLTRRQVLTRQAGDAPQAPHTYWVRGADDDLFDPVPLRAAGGHLRAPTRRPTRRFDIRRTVSATLRRAGLFTPVYRSRRVHPEYLVLLDRALPAVHGSGPAAPAARDHLAAYGESLIGQLRAEQVIVHVYHFDRDPRRARPADDPKAVARDLRELEASHGDARLMLLTDGAGLFEPFSGMPVDWLEDFRHWPARMLLTPKPAGEWGYAEATLALKGFAVAPMHPASLPLLAEDWLPLALDPAVSERNVHEQRLLAPIEAAARRLPDTLQRHGARWLEPEPPTRLPVRDLLAELRDYLGEQGFRLLQALAVYPELTWPLTLYVDRQLMTASVPGVSRASRLLALSRLPWLRYGRMPDYLRLALVRSQPRSAQREVMDLFRTLLDAADREGRHAIALHIDAPPDRGFSERLRAWLRRGDAAYGDRIFAKVLLGGTPRWLDVEIPDALARWLPGSGWSDAALKAVFGLAAATGLAAMLYGVGGYAQPWMDARLKDAETARFATVDVILAGIVYEDWLAGPLANLLRQHGFNVTRPPASVDEKAPGRPLGPGPGLIVTARPLDATSSDGREITAARWIADRLHYLGYGRAVRVENRPANQPAGDASNPNPEVWISLADSPPMFQDPLGAPAVRHLPEMIVIPAGTYTMGSPPNEQGRSDDEGPQHPVRIGNFALGRYEVTFDEYDEFARATGRELPNDEGWGRGRRPVINVSWDDARAYADWLAKETGQRWRLPTEAEWEYAARADTTTRRYWGDDPKDDKACGYANVLNRNKLDEVAKVYSGAKDSTAFPCDDPYPFTAPVGGFAANAFGLQDMLGNVWEWVQDCYHDSYEGGPADGSAQVSGDCGSRVLRGGSWLDRPVYIRAANRGWNNPVLRNDSFGFRLARDLP